MSDIKAPNIKLHVTQHIIDTAVRKSKGKCMVARAIREWGARTNRQVWSIDITSEKILFNIGELRCFYEHPIVSALNLKQWDDEKKGEKTAVKPFTVSLRDGFTRPVNRRHVPGTAPHKYKPRKIKIDTADAKGSGTTKTTRRNSPRKCDRRHAGLQTYKGVIPGHLAHRAKGQTK